ncbi:MAG: hypothetical protein EA397_02390 [Deltaproteobacteria bacterium]|nr:MAG: hypothetical protein EA397_02390 [Deltaproteobacteria bacterium]
MSFTVALCLGCHAEDGGDLDGFGRVVLPGEDPEWDSEGEVREEDEEGGGGDHGDSGAAGGEASGSDQDGEGGSRAEDTESNRGTSSLREGEKLVFLTSETYSSDLRTPFGSTPTESADRLCELHAEAAGLDGRWIAWLSGPDDPVIDRLEDHSPWHLTDGGTVAISSLLRLWVSGPNELIDRDEFGRELPESARRIWTGTSRYGATSSQTCSGWTGPAYLTYGTTGLMVETAFADSWTQHDWTDCRAMARLLCIEQ